jgi:hypothetical protein
MNRPSFLTFGLMAFGAFGFTLCTVTYSTAAMESPTAREALPFAAPLALSASSAGASGFLAIVTLGELLAARRSRRAN